MNHELLKRVIYDQHEVIARTRIVPRDYVMEKNANYVLTGMRRVGKSTMLYSIVQRLIEEGASWNEITYINFEDERLAEFGVADFDDIVAVQSEMCGGHGYFFFDEIQNVDGWEKFARRLADSEERVYITGSNAKMLSREIEGVLGGRYLSKWPKSSSPTPHRRSARRTVPEQERRHLQLQGVLGGYRDGARRTGDAINAFFGSHP